LDGHVPLLVEHLFKFIKRECSITNIVTVAQNNSEDSSLAMGLSDTLGRIVADQGFNLEFCEAKERIFVEIIQTLQLNRDESEEEGESDEDNE
jgi:hypothetical protein